MTLQIKLTKLENEQQTEKSSRTSQPMEIQVQNPVTATEQLQEGHTRNEPVPFLNRSYI